MAARQATRRRRPLLVAVAAIWFVFGLMLLASALRGRFGAPPPPPPGVSPPPPTTVTIAGGEEVVVAAVPLRAGDQLDAVMVEKRAAAEVMRQFPALGPAESQPGQPLLPGYVTEPEQVNGQFLAVDVPEGMPIPAGALSAVSPAAHPLDPYRVDRITLAMPPEPTLHQLLEPGDRVDVFAVMGDRAAALLVPQARIVAIGRVAVSGSGLGREDTQYRGARYEAAVRKRQRLEQLRRQQEAQSSGQPPEETGAEPTEAPEGETGQAPAQAGGTAAEQADRREEGRALTLQVTPAEAHLLASCHRTVGVRLDFALHPRP